MTAETASYQQRQNEETPPRRNYRDTLFVNMSDFRIGEVETKPVMPENVGAQGFVNFLIAISKSTTSRSFLTSAHAESPSGRPAIS